MKDNLVRSQLVAAYEYFKNVGHEHNVPSWHKSCSRESMPLPLLATFLLASPV